ncbi:hypothetical protein [Stenotrophomonas maltophilia]|uniref:hypothetical protein n=1 Tax=Stenotrophomonas maltophilia TaxID=40324 RepID=UPI0034DAF0D8
MIDLLDQRRFYLTVAALFGLPGLVLGTTLAGLGVVVGVSEPAHGGLPAPPLMTAWGLAGLLGLLAWVRLSWAWCTAARAGLRAAHPAWWWLLAMGTAAALALVGVVAFDHSDDAMLLLAGPPVLVPTAILWLQQWRGRHPAACE